MAYPYVEGKQFPSDKDVPDHDSIQSHSLKIYLEGYTNDLSACKISNIATVTEEIMHIYQSLKDYYVINDTHYSIPWSANALHKVSLLFGTEIIL